MKKIYKKLERFVESDFRVFILITGVVFVTFVTKELMVR